MEEDTTTVQMRVIEMKIPAPCEVVHPAFKFYSTPLMYGLSKQIFTASAKTGNRPTPTSDCIKSFFFLSLFENGKKALRAGIPQLSLHLMHAADYGQHTVKQSSFEKLFHLSVWQVYQLCTVQKARYSIILHYYRYRPAFTA